MAAMVYFVFGEVVEGPREVKAGIGVVAFAVFQEFFARDGFDGGDQLAAGGFEVGEEFFEGHAAEFRQVFAHELAGFPFGRFFVGQGVSVGKEYAEEMVIGDEVVKQRAYAVPALGVLPVEFFLGYAFETFEGRASCVFEHSKQVGDGIGQVVVETNKGVSLGHIHSLSMHLFVLRRRGGKCRFLDAGSPCTARTGYIVSPHRLKGPAGTCRSVWACCARSGNPSVLPIYVVAGVALVAVLER